MKLTALTLAALLLMPLPGAPQEPIRVDVHLINVAFSVRDSGGNLAPNLAQDDFEVLEDGVPQKISFFAHSHDVPLTLGLLVDFSSSQEQSVKPHHQDIEAFLKTALHPRDRAFLVAFAKVSRLLSDYTDSAKELRQSLENFERAKDRSRFPLFGPVEYRTDCGNTSFFDAVYDSVAEKLGRAETGRKAAIIFSDGDDISSAHTETDVIEAVEASDVVLYCVRYTETVNGRLTARNKNGTSVMRRLAAESGGAEYDARERGLAEHLQQISEQLRSSYELAYHTSNPVNDGQFHKITVRVRQPGLTVHAKNGYYAR